MMEKILTTVVDTPDRLIPVALNRDLKELSIGEKTLFLGRKITAFTVADMTLQRPGTLVELDELREHGLKSPVTIMQGVNQLNAFGLRSVPHDLWQPEIAESRVGDNSPLIGVTFNNGVEYQQPSETLLFAGSGSVARRPYTYTSDVSLWLRRTETAETDEKSYAFNVLLSRLTPLERVLLGILIVRTPPGKSIPELTKELVEEYDVERVELDSEQVRRSLARIVGIADRVPGMKKRIGLNVSNHNGTQEGYFFWRPFQNSS